jgi:hypothetical protein
MIHALHLIWIIPVSASIALVILAFLMQARGE